MEDFNSSMRDENFETNSNRQDSFPSVSGSTRSANSTAGPLIASNYSHYQIRVTSISQSDFETPKGSKYSSIQHSWVQRLRPKSNENAVKSTSKSPSPSVNDDPTCLGNSIDDKSSSGNWNQLAERGFENEASCSAENTTQIENRRLKESSNFGFRKNEMFPTNKSNDMNVENANTIQFDSPHFPFDRDKHSLKVKESSNKYSVTPTTEKTLKPVLSNFGFLKSRHVKENTPVSPLVRNSTSPPSQTDAISQTNLHYQKSNSSPTDFIPNSIVFRGNSPENTKSFQPVSVTKSDLKTKNDSKNPFGSNGSTSFPLFPKPEATVRVPLFAKPNSQTKDKETDAQFSFFETFNRFNPSQKSSHIPQVSLESPIDEPNLNHNHDHNHNHNHNNMKQQNQHDHQEHNLENHHQHRQHPQNQQYRQHQHHQKEMMNRYLHHPYPQRMDELAIDSLKNDPTHFDTDSKKNETQSAGIPQTFDFYPKFNESKSSHSSQSPNDKNLNQEESSTATLPQDFIAQILQKENSKQFS